MSKHHHAGGGHRYSVSTAPAKPLPPPDRAKDYRRHHIGGHRKKGQGNRVGSCQTSERHGAARNDQPAQGELALEAHETVEGEGGCQPD